MRERHNRKKPDLLKKYIQTVYKESKPWQNPFTQLWYDRESELTNALIE